MENINFKEILKYKAEEERIKLEEDTIRCLSTVNKELLGPADDDKYGIVNMLRQGAGLTKEKNNG